MDENVELLNYIYQNAQMGIDTISQLLDIVEDNEYKGVLQSQYNEYKTIFDTADEKLKQHNKEGKDNSIYNKISSYIMINVKTLTDKTPSHISEMLIQGSTMGIIAITKKINSYKNTEPEFMELAKRLLKFEENNVEQCKQYLKQ
jgi:hypothetical protein